MKKSLLAFIITLMAYPILAQIVEKNIAFENTVLTSVTSEGENILVGGKINIPGSMKITDGFVAKVDKNGTVLWQNYFGGPLVDEIRDITYQNGYIYAVGITWTKQDRAQVWLVILSDDGKIIKQQYFGEKLDDAAYRIIPSNDKGLFILGYTTPQGMKYRNLWVIKIDQQGNILWQKQLGTVNEIEEAYSGSFIDNDLIILARYWKMGVSDINPWIIKMDDNGNILWDRKISMYEDNYFVSALTFSQQIWLWGNTWHRKTTHKGDLWLMSLNNSGKTLLDKTIGTSAVEVCNKALMINNSFWLFGSFGRNASACVWNISSQGEVISQKVFQFPQINDALLLDNNHVAIVGGKASDGYLAILRLK